MKKLIKISNGNGMSFGEGLQRKDINQIIQRLGRKRQRDEKDLEIQYQLKEQMKEKMLYLQISLIQKMKRTTKDRGITTLTI